MTKIDIFEQVTNQIIGALDKGIIPWQRPWSTVDGQAPRNLSGRYYTGINPFLLNIVALSNGYTSPFWATFNQIRKAGGKVTRGSHGTTVVYWKFIQKTEVDPNTNQTVTRSIPFLRYWTVFNLDQTDLKAPEVPAKAPVTPVEACEKIVAGFTTAPVVRYGGGRACYIPQADAINMPKMEDFNSAESFYATLFHEFIHATGHTTRLDRDSVMKTTGFGTEVYSREELIAEFGAAMLAGVAGIAPAIIDNSVAYVQHWKEFIKNDPRACVVAAGAAQKAATFILGTQSAEQATDEESNENESQNAAA